jgi:gluconate 2-dehydrogenase gamma chain
LDSDDQKIRLSRRAAFQVAATGIITTVPLANAIAKSTSPLPQKPSTHVKNHYLFLQKHEADFLEAATQRLIPADDEWGGALEAGVVNYIDQQLHGSWGAGERLYRSGPWIAGTKGQGYQLPYTPAELFRTALRALDKDLKSKKINFEKLTAGEQDDFLKKLEASDQDLDGVPAKVFFSSMYQMTMEGFFADPSYGGNKDMISWRMIGFPGAYASYYDLVDKHGIEFKHPPMSLAQDSAGRMHMHTNTSAKSGAAKDK